MFLCGNHYKFFIVFNILQQILWITFIKKLDYRFLVDVTEIENASFPYKTVMSEANVKTNRMGSTKTELCQ